jgi:curli production assembly/transport component CsgF
VNHSPAVISSVKGTESGEMGMKTTTMVTGLAFLLTATIVSGSELIYRPVNPNFGGSPLNGSVLLNQANAQNSFEDPDALDFSFEEQSTVDGFTDTLNRLILSQLAGLIVQEVFGDVQSDGLDTGINTFSTDGFSITIDSSSGKTLGVDIVDEISGDSASLEIPYF